MLSKQGLLEALLFASGEPIEKTRLRELLSLDEKSLDLLVEQLECSFAEATRGVQLRYTNDSLQLLTKPEAADLVLRLTAVRQYRLSQPTLEVLAIVAYKQPITRAEIEEIRGVKCERALLTLAEKELVCEVGRKDTIGRPILYGTTERFLHHFNLRSLKDLPTPGLLP
ncbi:MAG: SMC-Scp complex subunit ScpB [Firmicutes bacterium]|nr:SMC-Scp complex subunit ScpB [Dethiobacter sp.]MBS3889345.1 SMC-Scp complex subunit ScpB [Bacillota bacterium]MBS4055325.1 SMC-Scp complex subunit ScpB [Thermaerobacter sp.]